MNSIYIILAVTAWLFLSYKLYGRFLEKQLKINNKTKTPAQTVKNNIDYSPAKKPYLIGHHFASIAGAGPIIGPILALSYFGWLPVVIWASLGSVFIGGVHDYVVLVSSVRNKAKGIANIASDYLNTRSGKIFAIMVWLTLMLIITVFSVSSAESIVNKPDLVVPLLAITLIAIVLGYGIKKYNWGKLASIIALLLVFFFAYLGYLYPINLPISNPTTLKNVWITIIILYAGIASILPVSFLLRPRDYLSALQMAIIFGMGILSLIIVRPEINAPMYQSSPIPLWPILFITVACGAISGFHSLVASGTTSKQLAKESDAKPVAYGSMLLEGLLAVFVVLVVAAGLGWKNNQFQISLEQGWVVAFSSGFGNIVGAVGIPGLTIAIAGLLGAFMVNQFILTSVDTATRIGRMVMSESLIKKLKNRAITTLIILIPAWLIAITNTYETLWKLFGSANQLIGAIALITISSYFVSKSNKNNNKKSKIKIWFLIIPAVLVLITTLAALAYLTFSSTGYWATRNYILTIISVVMFGFGVVAAWEGFNILRKKRK